MQLETPIEQIAGVGPAISKRLGRLGIATIRDLLFYYPRAWQDFSKIRSINSLRLSEDVIIRAEISHIRLSRTFRKRMTIVEADLLDSTGQIRAIWFNQPFLIKVLKPGETWLFAGKVSYDFKTGQKTLNVSQQEKKPVILPIYSETEGISSKMIRRLVEQLLRKVLINDYLPKKLRDEENLIDLQTAIETIHFPRDFASAELAKNRLAFDELFLIATMMNKIRLEVNTRESLPMKIDNEGLRKFVEKLPFKLTNGQRKAAWEIIKDLTLDQPMNRLLEGDVGSGKTVVAAMGAYVVFLNSYQTVWLAPTEILANQHFQNVSRLLEGTGARVGLMTSAKKKVDFENDNIIIGTHALLQKNIQIHNLGLIIIDEQHRFGVRQRAHLKEKSDLIPHLLSMTATPIPRSLALSVYGDLNITVIDELPPGRQKVKTYVVKPEDRGRAYDFIRKEVGSGRQVFVICPLIEDGKSLNLFDLEKKSVKGEFEKLSKTVFPQFKTAMIHGRLKSREKEKIMQGFYKGKINILVATAVIEVGIDVPNATIMMIEGADHFGLAQLHQFRGRVGRGKYQSYCFLFSEGWNEKTEERLRAMVKCENGFRLAEIDLEMRGPGELIGVRQSGLPDLKMASLSDIMLVKRAQKLAKKVLEDGLERYPRLQVILQEFEKKSHFE